MKLFHFQKNFHKWFACVLAAGCLFAAGKIFAATTNEFTPAQDLVIRAWGTEKGLPQNTVNAITQTRDGYLWLATQEGLARFDGVRFTEFGLQDGLPSVEVHAICEDSAGTLWIGTSGGLSRLVNGRIENVLLPSRMGAVVTTLMEDAAGRLWVGTRNGLGIYQNGDFIEDQILADLGQLAIYSLAQDHNGDVWIAGGIRGLFQFHDHHFTRIPGPTGNEQYFAHCLLEDKSGILWMSIGNGMILCRRDEAWITYNESDGLPFVYVTTMVQEADGTIWAGSLDDGLYRFSAGRFTAIRKENGLSANDIRSLCPDREGNLWVGTRIGGLDRLSRSKLITYNAAEGLTNDYTRGVAESADGTLWVGTTGGGLYSGNAGRFIEMPNEDGIFRFAFVDSVLAATDGSIWYGANRGLLRLKNGKLINYSTNQLWVQSIAVSALCDDNHGGVWIGTTDSKLVHFKDGKFIPFPHRRIARGIITSLAQETNGALWVGSESGGLKRIQPENNSIFSLTNGLLSQSIRTLHLDADGTLWIGTLGGGLSRYRDGHVVTFTTQQGLWADTISQIVPDDNDNLWCGCNRGIFRVSKKELDNVATGKSAFVHPRVFGLDDGMLAEECSGGFSPAGLRTKSGLICFSTVKGLVFLDPELHMKTLPREALLEEVMVTDGKIHRLESESIIVTDMNRESLRHLTIQHGAWEIDFHYTAISLSSPESVLFRYRLEGLDKDWIEAGARRTAYYHRVPPGDYTFQVTACNADGIWSNQKATIAITVQPYFWETLWFQITAAIIVLILISWIVRSRYRHRLARLEMQHAVEKERLRISKDIHDDIGGILTQVSQISDLGQSGTETQPILKSQFARIGHQSRAAVQALDEIVWATNPKNDNLPRFAEYVSRFADECFENSSIRCWQEVPTDLPALPLRSNVRHNIFLAVKEALNNILKHSGATEVWLRLALEDTKVRIEIEDNGHGFISSEIAQGGNGLDNMKTRLEECRGQMELTSAPKNGSKIRFTFPLPKTE